MSVLEGILEAKRRELARRRAVRSLAEVQAAARDAPPVRSLREALEPRNGGLRVVAEVKKASPSRGVIRDDFDPVRIARAYEEGGARAISVLTDEEHFQGKLEFLEAIRREVSVPLLRKDFLVDPYQVWEARAAGADAVLLIVAALEDDALRRLSEEARALAMDVLWEVHDLEEARRLGPFAPSIVGVNNRDLRTFEVDLETTRRILPELPPGVLCISESGFSERGEIDRAREWGVDAFLVGESLMRAPDPGSALAELLAGGARPGGARR